MKHKQCKMIALLMSVLLLVSVPLFPMHADEEANLLIISDNVAVSSSQVSERQDDPADSNSIINSSSNETQLIIPEIIQDHELCRNFVSRRFEEEKSLYDLVFENEDHTLTSFIYQTPVKYVTEEGNVRDISTELYVISGSVAEPLKKDTNSMQLTKEQASDVLNGIYTKGTVAFGSLDNRVRSWYPENIGDGIGLTDGIYSIRMTPNTDIGLNAKAAADQNSVLYADVFEENITIRYTPTWNGIKEEIILFSVPEGNSFQFLLNCEGSMIRESEDSIIVTSLETGQTIGSFDPILVYDADGRLTTGSISLLNTDQGQLLTITVDPAFFISAAYPVTIDPSLSFYNVEDGFSWFIQEAGLYSDSGAWGSSFNTMHYVGMNPIDNDYSGRILYRFPVLWDEYYPFHNFYPDQIVSFELHMSTTPSTVSQFCSLYTDFYNSSSWTHGNRICDATAYNNIAWGHYEWTTRSNDDSEITADITQKSKLWISYMRGLTSLSYANPYNGIAVICMQEDTEHCTVKTVSPYGSNLVQTYVTITYRAHSYMGDFYINNLDSRLFWNRLGFTSQGTMTDLGNTVRWTSELVVDGSVPKYAIHPYIDSSFYIGQNGSIAYFYDSYCLWRFEEDTYGVKIVNDVTGELLVENSDYPYISTTSTDTGLSCRWRFIRPSAYREVTLASLAIEELYGQKDIPQSVLPKLIRYNVDFVDAEDFRIDPVDITSATGSINGLVTGLVEIDFQRVSITHIPTGICKNFSFYTTISDGTYFIKNAETRMFAQLCDSDGPYYSSSNAPIEGWAFDGEAYQRWQFIHLGDGYFKILSQQSGKALSVKSGYANSSTEPLVQYTYSYGNSLQRWKIDWNSSGRFILRPESGESYSTDWCMCYGTYSSIPEGVTIRQNGYVSDSNYSDEWNLTKIQYHAIVYNYYDLGYLARNNETHTVSQSQISLYLEMVRKQYLMLFGLEIDTSLPVYYESPIDICKEIVSSTNIDSLCDHSNPHTILFGNTNALSNDFASNTSPMGSNIISKIYWSGHRIKTYLDVEEYNRCYSFGHSVFMLELTIPENRLQYSTGILMHELNHQFGALDHYHEILSDGTCRGGEYCSYCGSNPRPSTCIMNHSRINISSPTVICQDCMSEILDHLDDHHVEQP